MTPQRWKQIDETAQAALDREGDERAAFLDEACAGDDELRREVESQIAYQQEASKFLEEPAFKQAADHLGAQASLPAFLMDTQTESESIEGRTISHYSILRKLGAGGMGEVYLAEDITLNRKVAIKFLSQNSVAGEQAKKRLVREAKAAAALDHPHICAVHEVGEEGAYSFIVMQYVEGETLACRIQRKPLGVRDVLDIAVQIADALAEAHSRRIIHRDIKPQNVMLTTSGQVKVLDFGLARVVREGSLIDSIGETESILTAPGSMIGTVPYMSPEQVRGEALDGRSDIFSFGTVLYEMLSGRQPFQAESIATTISSILTKEPPPLARYASDVPDELQRIVRKALSKDKDGRYQGIRDLLIDLRELKQELEFEAKLERSIEPVVRDRSTAAERAESVDRGQTETAPPMTVRTDESLTPDTTSSTRLVVGENKRHKLGISLTLAALIITAVTAYFYFNRKPVLTDKDTILLTDFDNRTGDAVFDGTLKQALAVHLRQSPFLNLFTDDRVRETLRLMNRLPDERVTSAIGREICQRQGLKAMLTGSIASLGRNYVINLEAVDAQTSEVLASEQTEAEGPEQVLRSLGEGATRLRAKLGESLRSIQRFNKPLEEATTSKLEAFQAYALGSDLAISGRFMEAIPIFERAIEIDHDFATAYNVLSIMHSVTGRPRRAAEYAEKAYALKDRVSEYEKLRITSRYHLLVTGDETKRIEMLMLQKQMYPREWTGWNDIGGAYTRIGQFDQAIAEFRESIRLNPNFAAPYRDCGLALLRLNRFVEAKDVLAQALQQKLDTTDFHSSLYQIAFIDNDSASMRQQIDWTSGKPDEYVAFDWQTGAAAFAGQWRRAQELARRAIDLASRGDTKEVAARYEAEQALRAAVFGQFTLAKAAAASSLGLERNKVTLTRAALALALIGDASQAQPLVDELIKRYPKDTVINGIWLPAIRAALELQHGNAAQAIELLEVAKRYEPASEFWPQYLRGQAHLKLNKGAEAAAEFQKILDHRGQSPLSPLCLLTHLGLARAAMLQGDTAKARKLYQDFLALWKDADADLPILIQAKKEYAALK